MNIIVIMIDSLRPDHLGCYGNDWIETPNMDRFAEESVLFENAYPEGLPTIPVRTALFTGQHTLPYRPWQPLVDEDLTAAEILLEHGYKSALITDAYHLFKPGMNFHRGFHAFRWIRGQEADAYESASHGKNLNAYIKPAMKGSGAEKLLEQYLRNTTRRTREEDYFVAQVVLETIDWLRHNYMHEKFFLWIDSFDPHEPWDPPPPYDAKYTAPDYKGPKLIHPKYGSVDWMTEEELEYARGLYAGEVSFVDKWLGRLLEEIDKLGLWQKSLVVLLSDHGIPLGDHGTILKSDINLYDELLRIPLLIRHPQGLYAGNRLDALVQTHDILPTILDVVGLPEEAIAMHGQSVWPVVARQQEKIRDYVVVGYHESDHRCVRDREWSYVHRPEGWQCELYNLVEDPEEERNLIDQYPEKAEELASQLPRSFHVGTPEIRSIQLRHEIAGSPIKF